MLMTHMYPEMELQLQIAEGIQQNVDECDLYVVWKMYRLLTSLPLENETRFHPRFRRNVKEFVLKTYKDYLVSNNEHIDDAARSMWELQKS